MVVDRSVSSSLQEPIWNNVLLPQIVQAQAITESSKKKFHLEANLHYLSVLNATWSWVLARVGPAGI
jgi:hypothetical protein